MNLILPTLACSLFIALPHRAATSLGTTIAFMVFELLTGRMLGVLSLSFAVAAVVATFADRFVAFSRDFVRTVVIATCMSFVMLGISVVITSYVYGRGAFVARLGVALPVQAWWMVPGLCILIVVFLAPPWRSTDDVPTA